MKKSAEIGQDAPVGKDFREIVESRVANLVCVWLFILPWLIGGHLWWAQALNLVVGAVALGMAIGPVENRKILRRFPVFWLGLAFLAVLICQALNPWIRTEAFGPGIFAWHLWALKHVDWLPAGVKGDYFQMNAWRTLVYWMGPWLLVCAWWVAVRQRRSGRRLGWVIFGNGVLVALVVLLEGINPPEKVLGFYTEPGMNTGMAVSAAFTYRTAAAMFMYLSLGVGFAIACRLHARGKDAGSDKRVSWLVLLGCLVILASFFVNGSRAGLAIGGALFVAGFFLLLLTGVIARKRSRGLWLGLGVLLLGLSVLVVAEVKSGRSWTIIRWSYRATHPEEDVRLVLREQTIRMIQDHPWLGFGGGSYGYISPDYFRTANIWGSSSNWGGLSHRTDYAHCDWLQLPMEFGLIGAGLLLAILIYWYGYALWLARWLGTAGWMMLLTTVALLAHATVDFPIYNTALFTVFSLMLASTVKTAVLRKQFATA